MQQLDSWDVIITKVWLEAHCCRIIGQTLVCVFLKTLRSIPSRTVADLTAKYKLLTNSFEPLLRLATSYVDLNKMLDRQDPELPSYRGPLDKVITA